LQIPALVANSQKITGARFERERSRHVATCELCHLRRRQKHIEMTKPEGRGSKPHTETYFSAMHSALNATQGSPAAAACDT